MTSQLRPHALAGSTAVMVTLSSVAAPSPQKVPPPRPAQRDPPAPATPPAHQLPSTKQCPVVPLRAQACEFLLHMEADMSWQCLYRIAPCRHMLLA